MSPEIISLYQINFENRIIDLEKGSEIAKVPLLNLPHMCEYLGSYKLENLRSLLEDIDDVINGTKTALESSCFSCSVYTTFDKTYFMVDGDNMNYPNIPTLHFKEIIQGWREFLMIPPLAGTNVQRPPGMTMQEKYGLVFYTDNKSYGKPFYGINNDNTLNGCKDLIIIQDYPLSVLDYLVTTIENIQTGKPYNAAFYEAYDEFIYDNMSFANDYICFDEEPVIHMDDFRLLLKEWAAYKNYQQKLPENKPKSFFQRSIYSSHQYLMSLIYSLHIIANPDEKEDSLMAGGLIFFPVLMNLLTLVIVIFLIGGSSFRIFFIRHQFVVYGVFAGLFIASQLYARNVVKYTESKKIEVKRISGSAIIRYAMISVIVLLLSMFL